MKYIDKLIALADKLEHKLAQQPIVLQNGTTELFFGDDGKQRSFSQAVSGANGGVGKFLVDYAAKTQKTASFDLKANAEPQKGATWILSTNPSSLKAQIAGLLNADFKAIVGASMSDKAKEADAKAKAGGGSGTLDVASFSADMD